MQVGPAAELAAIIGEHHFDLAAMGFEGGQDIVVEGVHGSDGQFGRIELGPGMAGTVTINDWLSTLPKDMTGPEFGKLAGFVQRLEASSRASTIPTSAAIDALRAAGVSRLGISTGQAFYAGVASASPTNLSAVHRAALLSNMLKVY